jgi:hypothetical protein
MDELWRNTRRQDWLVIAIFAGGVLARVLGYTASSIRYDEALTLYRAVLPFGEYLQHLEEYSSIMSWELLIRLLAWGGTELWYLRMAPLALGIGALVLTWQVSGQMALSQPARLVVLFLSAFTPGLLWISQDARPYALQTFLFLLALLFTHQRRWLGWAAACGLMIYTHAVGPAFALASLVYALQQNRTEWNTLAKYWGLVLLTWLPAGILLQMNSARQAVSGEVAAGFWTGSLTPGTFTWSFADAFFTHAVAAGWKAALAVALAASLILSTWYAIRTRSFHLAGLLLPGLAFITVSLSFTNVATYRTLILLMSPLYLALGILIDRRHLRILEVGVSVLWLVVCAAGISFWQPAERGGQVEQLAASVRAQWQEGDIIYYGGGLAALPLDYYLSPRTSYLLDGTMNENVTPGYLRLFPRLSLEQIPFKRAWLVFPEARQIPPAQYARLLRYAQSGEWVGSAVPFNEPPIQVYLIKALP